MTAAHLLRDEPESARTCIRCGTTGTLGQYISDEDTLVWAHLGCARILGLEAVDGGPVTKEWEA